jgi:hypothetical protein
VLVPHRGGVDAVELGQQIKTWLEKKGFETKDLAAQGALTVISAREPAAWKKAIGADLSLEVSLRSAGDGIDVDVRLVKAGSAAWTAKYPTYSWIATGISFNSLKKELEQSVKKWIRGREKVGHGALRVLEVVETDRSERSLGTDVRTIDNRASETTVVRTIKASKRWRQTCQIDIEKSRAKSKDSYVILPELLSVKSIVEDSVRRQYSISTDVEQAFEEEVTLTVQQRTGLIIYMDWKRIVQHGYVRLVDPFQRVIEVPFEVDVGVTFDQRQRDER